MYACTKKKNKIAVIASLSLPVFNLFCCYSWHIITRRKAGSHAWCVLTLLELVHLIKLNKMLQKPEFPFTEGTLN